LISRYFESTHVSLTVKVETEALIYVSQSGTIGRTVETNVFPAQFNRAANNPIQQRARNRTARIPATDGQTMNKDRIAFGRFGPEKPVFQLQSNYTRGFITNPRDVISADLHVTTDSVQANMLGPPKRFAS
jgi:hypothetical protein